MGIVQRTQTPAQAAIAYHSTRLRARTWAILAGMAALLVALGWGIAGPWSLIPIVLAAGGVAVRSKEMEPRRIAVGGAYRLGYSDAPRLVGAVDALSRRAGLPATPQVLLVPSATPNAAAVGVGDNAVLTVTEGLLRRLPEREFMGVLAHEIAHIRNGDLKVFALTEVARRFADQMASLAWILMLIQLPLLLTGTVPINPLFLVLLPLTPLAMVWLQRALMREREYAADLGAAALTGDPVGLALALRRLDAPNRWWRSALPIPADAVPSWVSTHPPTEERVRRLATIAEGV